MDIKEQIKQIAVDAKKSASVIARTDTKKKNATLLEIAEQLVAQKQILLAENAKDILSASVAALSTPMLDRLTLNEESIYGIADGIRQIVALPDPIGEITSMWRRPNGLQVGKMRIPLGVVGIIYEARPNVTADAAALCLKSGNAVILRGGSEAIHTNIAIGNIINNALQKNGLPIAAVQIIPTTDRQAVYELLQLEEFVDLIIPRGGEALIRAVVAQSKIPVIKHYKGVCHIFVDDNANIQKALSICLNAKTQRAGVCNAMETLLIHTDIAQAFLPLLAEAMSNAGVQLRGCLQTCAILKNIPSADESDWHEEYLSLILSVRIVNNIDEAIAHIEKYGSLHTEAIITDSYENSQKFINEVNSSTVVVNASTRFSDGFELGLGAEIGISTTKLHAYGPMGLEGLTTTKFIIYGNGQVRQ
ncbi:MAG: glutamate-5-semialdehyde dehydrogenase [Deltaproteobacteria bacterium]